MWTVHVIQDRIEPLNAMLRVHVFRLIKKRELEGYAPFFLLLQLLPIVLLVILVGLNFIFVKGHC
jgi:hypothetical protein